MSPRTYAGRFALTLLLLCAAWGCEGEDSATGDLDVVNDVAGEIAQTDTAKAVDCVKASDCGDNAASVDCRLWTCAQGSCLKVAAPDGVICQDGDVCHPGVCQLGACKSQEKPCKAPTEACRFARCDAADGKCKVFQSTDDTPCDDGLACSKNDTCQSGVCKADTTACPCAKDSDCVDDDNLCNGAPYCDQNSGKCKINPTAVVICPDGKDTACLKNSCQPLTGACLMTPVVDKTPCDDDDACTQGDACDGGACKPGAFVCECKADADCKDDGDVCNGTPFCNLASGKCALNPATVVTCLETKNTACQVNACDPKTGACGLQPTSEGKSCDDGSPCTKDETCTKGKCASKTNLCSCASDKDCASQDDANLCNGVLFCDQTLKTCVVNPATVVTCSTDDDPACATSVCQPATGACKLTNKPDATPCSDGDTCTLGDACAGGKCVPVTTAPQCVCTADSDCAKFEDGDLCNGTLVCDKGKSQCILNASSVVFCPKDGDTACLKNRCQPKTGTCKVTAATLDTACTDNMPCTVGDHCDKDGKCQPGNDFCQCGPHKPGFDCDAKLGDGNACNGVLWCDLGQLPFTCLPKPQSAVTCSDDGNPCTGNACDPKSGTCKSTPHPNGLSCTPAGKCDKAATCDKGVCVTTSSVDCDDKNPCTTEACDPKTGACKYSAAKDGAACTSPDKCVTAAACAEGKCAASKTTTCSGGTVCAPVACNPATGTCVTSQAKAGTPCSDPSKCVTKAACDQGSCAAQSTVSCDDGKPCTADTCDAKTGKCVFTPLKEGASCTLDDKCVASAACAAGACKATQAKDCSDGKACTADTCDPTSGTCSSVPMKEGAACTSPDKCVESATCTAGACKTVKMVSCDDGNSCTTEQCDGNTGKCATTPTKEGASCTTADKCAQFASCEKGVCKVGATWSCDDGSTCTTDACDPKTGACKYTPVTDGTSCTGDDKCAKTSVCQTGNCKATAPKDCDDSNPCTIDSCQSTSGCVHTPLATGTQVVCYNADPSTAGKGNCKAGKSSCGSGGVAGACVGEVTPKVGDDCGGGDEDCDGQANEDCAIDYKISAACGGGQEGKPGTALFLRMRVKVTDGSDIVQVNKKVNWTAPAGGSFATPSTTTDSKGFASNVFTLGSKDLTTYFARATVDGSTKFVDISATAKQSAPDYVVNYSNFCDPTLLKFTGVATLSGNSVRVVTGGDNANGSFSVAKPLTKNKSFNIKVNVSGYTRGYSIMLQSTTSGTGLGAGGYGDGGSKTRKPAFVVHVNGSKGGGAYAAATVWVMADGKQLASKNAFMPHNTNHLARSLWLDYDQSAKQFKLSVSTVGGSKPASASVTVTHDLWASLGSNGKPIYLTITAGNSSAGANGTKYINALQYSTP